MHSLMYVLRDLDPNETLEEVDSSVEDMLLDEGFVGEGYFSGGYCDWFAIGGRWSTILLEYKVWGMSVWDKAKEMLGLNKELKWDDPGYKAVEETVKKLIETVSEDKPPASAVVTQNLLECLKLHDSDVEVFNTAQGNMEVMSIRDLPKEIVRKTTITIVDYHN